MVQIEFTQFAAESAASASVTSTPRRVASWRGWKTARRDDDDSGGGRHDQTQGGGERGRGAGAGAQEQRVCEMHVAAQARS